MAGEHEYWQEQSEIFALGALGGEELKEFEAHLASGCAICAGHLRQTREVLNLMPRSLQPIAPPAAVKIRLLDQLVQDKAFPRRAVRPRTATRWRRIAGTIAAGIIGLLIGAGYYRLHYEPRHSIYTSVINLLRDPNTRDFPLYGAGPTPQAKGRFLWNESGEGHIFVTDLPAAPPGKMYAVWTIAAKAPPRYVGTIKTDTVGQGGLHVNAPRGEPKIETFAVTLEPDGTTAAPTGPMVLISTRS
jgi:anti-sigma-K factor RskA